MSKIFQSRLKDLRKDKEISQQTLADALQVKRYTLADWEQGRTEPDMEMIVKIACYFKVSTDYLLGIEQ